MIDVALWGHEFFSNFLLDTRLLGTTVAGQEMLVVLSLLERVIGLLNLETGEFHVAFSGVQEPWALCHGEPDRVWVYHRDHTVRELNCSRNSFVETGRIVRLVSKWSPPDSSVYMCYLPAPHRALILSFPFFMAADVKAVSCETGQQLWKFDTTDGVRMCVKGITFHPEQQVLLAFAHNEQRVVALDPVTGSHLQSLWCPGGDVAFSWSRDRLLILHGMFPSYISEVRLDDVEKGKVGSLLLNVLVEFLVSDYQLFGVCT